MIHELLRVPRRRLTEFALLFSAALMLLATPSAHPVYAAGDAASYELQIGGMT